ncbi:MAG: hypothetical protein PHP93_01930 [Kiritimatiellales bacterium]|nr:hypothetical protein [Kiritimatiellales bacterium]
MKLHILSMLLYVALGSTVFGEEPLRIVATGGRMGHDFSGPISSAAAFRHRTPHVLGGPVAKIQIGFMNWSHSYTAEVVSTNDITIEYAWLERESTGQVVPLTFSGNRQFVMPANSLDAYFPADVIDSSVWTGSSPAQDEVFWVNIKGSMPVGSVVYTGTPATWSGAKFITYDPANDPGTYDTTGSVPAISGSKSYYKGIPLVFAGRYSEPGHLSVIGIGDSISQGSGDTENPVPVISGFGFFSRAALDENGSHAIAFFNLTRHGLGSSAWNSPIRMPQFLPLANVLVEELGTNDIGTNGTGDTDALKARLAGIWTRARNAGVQSVLRTKLLPRTTSTDAWASKDGQTPNTGWDDGGKRDIMNDFFDTEKSGGAIDIVVDTLDAACDPTDTHYWQSNGTTRYFTGDGTHPSPAGNAAMGIALRAALLTLAVDPSAPPATPAGLIAIAASTNQINLSWSGAAGADSYTVKRGITSGSYTTVASNITLTSYSDVSLSPATAYYYIISAVNTNGVSADSAEASAATIDPNAPPAAPTGLTATAAATNQIDLSWSTVADADSYTVKRGTSSGSYTTIASNVTVTSYSDIGLSSATTYYYVVGAFNINGAGADSAEVSAATTGGAPAIDTNHIVYSDNFESYPTNSSYSASVTLYKFDRTGIYDDTFNAGVTNPFGSGNQYASSINGGGTLYFKTVSLSAGTGLSTYSFDFYDPSEFTSSSATYFGLGTDDFGAKTYVAWAYMNGTLSLGSETVQESGSLPTLSADRVYTVYMLCNTSGSDQTIGGTSTVLANGHVALYFYDHSTMSLIDAGQYSSSNTSYPVPNVFVVNRNYSSSDGIYYVDNFVQTDDLLTIATGTSTPTPASLSFAYNNGMITIGSADLTDGATHTLQMKTNLTDAVWTDVKVTSGVSSVNWTITPENDHAFFRIKSQ